MTIVCIKSIDVHDLVDQYGKSSSGALTSNVEQVWVLFNFILIIIILDLFGKHDFQAVDYLW